MLKTIIISDLHLGAPDSKYHQLIDFLETHPCENLILNGDIIDGKYLKRFGSRKQEYATFFHTLQEIAKKNLTQITYIRGNHELWTDKVKVPKNFHIQEDMIYPSHGKKYYICHGDQFDSNLDKMLHHFKVISFIIACVAAGIYRSNRQYNKLRKNLGLSYHSLLTPIKNAGHRLFRGSDKAYEDKLIQKALEKHCDGIICGHNHKPADKILK